MTIKELLEAHKDLNGDVFFSPSKDNYSIRMVPLKDHIHSLGSDIYLEAR